jgi:hypothetical protein
MKNRHPLKQNGRIACLIATCLFIGLQLQGVHADEENSSSEPLKGSVEESGLEPTKLTPQKPQEPFAIPVVPPKLEGKAKEDQSQGTAESPKEDQTDKPLKGNAQDTDDSSFGKITPMDAKTAPSTLKGSAEQEDNSLASEDPDADDQQLAIEWDRWRNRLLNAIQSGVQDTLNNPNETNLRFDPRTGMIMPRFPLGTLAWFACQITNDKRVVHLKLLKTSGYPNYDQAVLDAITNLQGTSILRFPERSHRKIVTQVAGIKTSDFAERQPFIHFGDVEHYQIPGN